MMDWQALNQYVNYESLNTDWSNWDVCKVDRDDMHICFYYGKKQVFSIMRNKRGEMSIYMNAGTLPKGADTNLTNMLKLANDYVKDNGAHISNKSKFVDSFLEAKQDACLANGYLVDIDHTMYLLGFDQIDNSPATYCLINTDSGRIEAKASNLTKLAENFWTAQSNPELCSIGRTYSGLVDFGEDL